MIYYLLSDLTEAAKTCARFVSISDRPRRLFSSSVEGSRPGHRFRFLPQGPLSPSPRSDLNSQIDQLDLLQQAGRGIRL